MDDFNKTIDSQVIADVQNAHVADIVARLNAQDIETAASILAHRPLKRAFDVFDRPELARAGELILELPLDLAARILKGMSADRAADTLRQLDGHDRTKILSGVDFDTAMSLKLLLTY